METTLYATIKAAFSDCERPQGAVGIAGGRDMETAEVVDAYLLYTPDNIPVRILEKLGPEGLLYLVPGAYLYWLQAYLLAVIQPGGGGFVDELLPGHLCVVGKDSLALLSASQRQAVIDVLRHMLSGDCYDEDILRAISRLQEVTDGEFR